MMMMFERFSASSISTAKWQKQFNEIEISFKYSYEISNQSMTDVIGTVRAPLKRYRMKFMQ